MLKRMDSDARQSLLAQIEQSDPKLSEDLRAKLITLNDLKNVEARYLGLIFSELSDEEVMIVLSQSTEDLTQHLLSAFSKRKQQVFIEDLEVTGKAPKAQANDVLNRILNHVNQLIESGEIPWGEDKWI